MRYLFFLILILNTKVHGVVTSVDIDSYTFEYGKVTQNTCLYSKLSSTSTCLESLNRWSVLSSYNNRIEGSFTQTSSTRMNPNYRCNFTKDYRMYCSGGEPYFTINGWVYTPYFMTTRDRNKCDGFDEMDVYLDRPSISCRNGYCDVDVRYSPTPKSSMKVSAEIQTYNKKNRFIRREEEEETDYYPYGSTEVRIRIDDEVERVVVSDVECEKW